MTVRFLEAPFVRRFVFLIAGGFCISTKRERGFFRFIVGDPTTPPTQIFLKLEEIPDKTLQRESINGGTEAAGEGVK
jgi:hypothetical protein